MQLLILCAPVWFRLLALEVDLRPAAVLGQALGEVQRARPTDVVALEVGQFLLERRVVLGLLVLAGEVEDQRHQGLGDVLAAEAAEQALCVGAVAIGSHGGLQEMTYGQNLIPPPGKRNR